MIYKNLSNTTKTFYGVAFKPNEVHEVPGCINHPKFLRVDSKSSELNTNAEVLVNDKPDSSKKETVSARSTSTKKGVNANGSDTDK